MLSALAAAAAITFAPVPIANCLLVYQAYAPDGIYRMQWDDPVIAGKPSVTIQHRKQRYQFSWYETPGGGGPGLMLYNSARFTSAIKFGPPDSVIIPDLHEVLNGVPKGLIWRKTSCL